MITLASLPTASAQEVFDQVARHLLTQNRQAKNTHGNCRYRYRPLHDCENVLKCAAGCLIDDSEYQESFEGWAWCDLPNAPKKHVALICALQVIHDNREPEIWKEELSKLAKEYQLSSAVLEN